jgi:hypothetical protein
MPSLCRNAAFPPPSWMPPPTSGLGVRSCPRTSCPYADRRLALPALRLQCSGKCLLEEVAPCWSPSSPKALQAVWAANLQAQRRPDCPRWLEPEPASQSRCRPFWLSDGSRLPYGWHGDAEPARCRGHFDQRRRVRSRDNPSRARLDWLEARHLLYRPTHGLAFRVQRVLGLQLGCHLSGSAQRGRLHTAAAWRRHQRMVAGGRGSQVSHACQRAGRNGLGSS